MLTHRYLKLEHRWRKNSPITGHSNSIKLKINENSVERLFQCRRIHNEICTSKNTPAIAKTKQIHYHSQKRRPRLLKLTFDLLRVHYMWHVIKINFLPTAIVILQKQIYYCEEMKAPDRALFANKFAKLHSRAYISAPPSNSNKRSKNSAKSLMGLFQFFYPKL